MVKWTPPLTQNQQIAIAIIPKITASLSIAGSMFIVQHVLRSKKRRGLCYHRILLGLSSMDVISSFKSFLSTWILPKETGAWGAVGSVATCTAAGFFGHGASIASPLYNGSLALFYLLTVKYGWKDDRSGAYSGGVHGGAFSRIEPWMHAIPLVFGWGTAIAGLPLRLYNPIGWTCWIAEVPRGCDRNPSVPCERGDNSYIYRWAFFHAELWFTFVAILVMMIMMYQSVRKTEQRSSRYSNNSNNHGNGSNNTPSYSRRVSIQALLYVCAYYLTWIFPAITWITQLFGKTYTPILMLQAFFVPLQGFFNAFVYLRPRYLRYRRQMPDRSRLEIILSTLSEGRRDRPAQCFRGPMGECGKSNGGDRGHINDSDFHSEHPVRTSFLKKLMSKHYFKGQKDKAAEKMPDESQNDRAKENMSNLEGQAKIDGSPGMMQPSQIDNADEDDMFE